MAIKLKINAGEISRTAEAEKGEMLLEVLRRNLLEIDSPCGGNGRCGKCRVKIDGREALACRSIMERDAEVEIIASDSKYVNETDMLSENAEIRQEDEFAAAVDLGTTTITAELINLRNNKTCCRLSSMNHQKIFGSDVISRIDAALSGRRESLKDAVRKDIISLLEKASSDCGIDSLKVKKLAISANTTMMHLLMGWDTLELSAAPFKPYSTDYLEKEFDEVFGKSEDFRAKVILLPSLSAFVGADIVSGIYALGMQEKEEITAFIDLGTNAEMAVGNRNGIFLTSAAAGPAFEGGNISMGMAGVEGAVSAVRIAPDSKKVTVSVIGDTEAKGICGTGLISAAAEMLRTGIVGDNGELACDYAEKGFVLAENPVRRIRISQEDLHNLLLAKAAVAAGYETLVSEAGLDFQDISRLYLAGSFAECLDTEDAFRIGLIPKEMKGKTCTVGNSSLKGAVRFLSDTAGARDEFGKILSLSHIVELSETKAFERIFVDRMTYRQ